MYTEDSKESELDAAPYITMQGERTLVPLRFISEQLGAAVSWNMQTETATIVKGNTVIELKPGTQEILVNGARKEIDCSPEIVSPGRLFVPLRFIGETLECEVDYDNETKTIGIKM